MNIYQKDTLLTEHTFVSTNIIDKSVQLRNSNTRPNTQQIPLKSTTVDLYNSKRFKQLCSSKKSDSWKPNLCECGSNREKESMCNWQ